jgi:uncharacterized protein
MGVQASSLQNGTVDSRTGVRVRHAIDVEHDGHVPDRPSAAHRRHRVPPRRGADPLRPFNGMPVVAEAEIRGHWLAAEIMRAWTGWGRKPAGPGEGPR